ncbi:hypothetical protein [Aquabacter spiritensis]|uniref:hypothetical protein n=1 Tax=Aquabacter spiritensis TaxID=933073 RepID=UPI00104420A9|nr:hypothetical protein [Aquabacter spiritensis]
MQQVCTSTPIRVGSRAHLCICADWIFGIWIRLTETGFAGRKLGIVASRSSHHPRTRLAEDDEQVVLARSSNIKKKHRSAAPGRLNENHQVAGRSHRAIRHA